MPTNQKDTIYIDVDDEITAIIDKVRSSKERIVALVLPKRATVLQSIVNMKLLKKTAENAKKHVVLITTEAGLMPLAGAVGLHVAPSLQSRPAIPPVPDGGAEPLVDESGDFDPDAVSDKPVGQLAGPSAVMADDLETIELDNDPVEDSAQGAGAAAGTAGLGAAAAKIKKNSKLKVPDFDKFRLLLITGAAALVALLVFFYFAIFVMPKATVTIATDSSDITTSANLTLDPTTKDLNLDERVLPAKVEQKQQTGTQQVAATGQKNKGTKAAGEVSMTAKVCGSVKVADPVPAGTGVSSGGKTFITQESTSFKADDIEGDCINFIAKNVTPVIAQTAGTSFNIEPTTFAVASRKDVAAKSSEAMTGGTDNIVKVVSQTDVDTAKQKITTQAGVGAAKSELQEKLEDAGYLAVASSLQTGTPSVTASANVGDEADVVTVTSATTHTMYGVKKADIEKLIRENIKDKIDSSKQQVLDTGINKATFDVNTPAASGPLQVAFSAVSLAGPDLKVDALKKQIAGKKTNDVRTLAKATPGVTDVNVKYSPFWVSKVPKKESKITIVIEKAAGASNNSANGNQP